MTKVERLVAGAYARGSVGSHHSLRMVRAIVRRTAYHEAGHVVARMFAGPEAGHVRRVSIIPAADSAERCLADALKASPCSRTLSSQDQAAAADHPMNTEALMLPKPMRLLESADSASPTECKSVRCGEMFNG